MSETTNSEIEIKGSKNSTNISINSQNSNININRGLKKVYNSITNTDNVDTSNSTVDTSNNMTTDTQNDVDENRETSSKNLVEIASETSDLSKLVELLAAADLVDTVKNASALTVLAPVNEAFEAISSALATLDAASVKDILLSHVIDGNVLSTQLVNGKKIKTLGSLELTFMFKNGNATLIAPGSEAVIKVADIKASNGIVHLIDSVLLPGSGKQEGHGLDPSTYGTYKSTDSQGNIDTLVITKDSIIYNEKIRYPFWVNSDVASILTKKDKFTIAITSSKQTAEEISPSLAGFIAGAGNMRAYVRLTYKNGKFEMVFGFVDPDNSSGLAALAGFGGTYGDKDPECIGDYCDENSVYFSGASAAILEYDSPASAKHSEGHGLSSSLYGKYKGNDGQGNPRNLEILENKITYDDTVLYPLEDGREIFKKNENVVSFLSSKQDPPASLAGSIGGAGKVRFVTRISSKGGKIEIVAGIVEADNPSGLSILIGFGATKGDADSDCFENDTICSSDSVFFAGGLATILTKQS